MSNPAIRVTNLSKEYFLGARQEAYRTFRDAIVDAAAAPLNRLRSLAGRGNGHAADGDEHIWALNDVSFDVQPGEVVGIIGRNGAGKSTLLKVLSRITEPARGRVEICGRVASLLEVGTGFHPELTGRENIFLNGAILGMGRREIERKFDEIVSFAEVEKFIDTPVKRYSSGMYLRLAFAVAAHLDPEILLVDEVLAVGDANFQAKCVGRMAEVGASGRTVLFVSHNMPMVLRLCPRAILLHQGSVVADGKSSDVTSAYLGEGGYSLGEREWPDERSAPGDAHAQLRSVRVLDSQGRVTDTMDIRQEINIEVEYASKEDSRKVTAILHFINDQGICLFASNDFTNKEWWETPRRAGMVRATCHIPGNFLAEGRVYVLVALGTYNPNVVHCLVRDAVSFQVVDQTQGDGVRGVYSGNWPGVVRPMLEWSARHQEGAAACPR